MLARALARWYLTSRSATRWLRRRFTVIGACLLIGLAVTLGTANQEQTMGFPTFLLLAAVIAIAGAFAPFFRVRFSVDREAPRLVTAGEPFILPVRIRNQTAVPQVGLDYSEDLHEAKLTSQDVLNRLREAATFRPIGVGGPTTRGSRCPPVAVPVIQPGAVVEIPVAITAWRRGPLLLAGGLVSRTDPFGIFRAFCRTAAPQTVLVLPMRYPLPPLALPGQSREQADGAALATGIGQSEEFVALRDYRRGDPLKHVHWRSAARTGRLVVKEYQDEHLMRHGLVLDTCCPATDDLRFEEAVAVAASFACTIPDQESLLDLLLVGDTAVHVTSGRGLGSTQQMLEVLATVRPTRRPQFDAVEALIARHRDSLSSCLVLLLAWDAPRRAVIRRLRAQRLPVIVMLLLPHGQSAPTDHGDPDEQPDRLIVLESGKIAEGLRALGHPS